MTDFMPQLTEGHRRLEASVGTWVGTETMFPSPMCPEGGQAGGRTETRLAHGGLYTTSDYVQTRDGEVAFTGHGVTCYDAAADEYVMHWFDCMGGSREEFRGRFEGEVITMRSKNPMGHARLTYDYGREPGALHSSMEMSFDGETWTKFFEGRYTRE